MKLKILFLSALVLLLTNSQIFSQPTFNKNKDLLLAQFDSRPDPDDIHAQAALGCMLAHSDLAGVKFYAVAGAYGTQNSAFIDSDNLFNMAFGNNWTDADADWNGSVTKIKNKVIPILRNGGKVFVQEAGQSNITADWIAEVKKTVAFNTVKNNVIVVQHSDWNEDKTKDTDLTYVKNNSTYYYIDDGNAPYGETRWGNHGPYSTPEYRSKNPKWMAQAKSSPNAKAKQLWTEADRIVDAKWPNGFPHVWSHIHYDGVDYSDCVENWFIFKIGSKADNNSKFWNRYVINTENAGGNQGTNSVNFANNPSAVVTGRNFNVQIAYEATQRYELVAIVNGPTGTWLTASKKTVSAGNGTATLTVNQATAWAVANGYKLGICMRPVGGGFNTNIVYKSTRFNIINGSRSRNANLTLAATDENYVGSSDLNSKVKAYPNPFNNELTISLDKAHTYNSVEIFDSYGRLLETKAISESNIDLGSSMENTSAGIYFIRLSGETAKTIRVIKH